MDNVFFDVFNINKNKRLKPIQSKDIFGELGIDRVHQRRRR